MCHKDILIKYMIKKMKEQVMKIKKNHLKNVIRKYFKMNVSFDFFTIKMIYLI